ncbi:hypothetical protein, partial [uncultured Parasutterella sp.]|uniref:hypothetical protein n=1 Tax=uncultured Parasutterella sp. TaxID=1263098 RepID=UPI002598B323
MKARQEHSLLLAEIIQEAAVKAEELRERMIVDRKDFTLRLCCLSHPPTFCNMLCNISAVS